MLDEYWNPFIDYITSFGKNLNDLGFNIGINLKKIEEAEKILRVEFPNDYKRLLELCNGQKFFGDSCYFNWLPTEMRLLEINEVVELWQNFKQYIDKNDINDYWDVYTDYNKIRYVSYHEKRIPIAETEGVASMFIDYVPGPKGTQHQIISIGKGSFVVLSESIEMLIKNYLTLIKKMKLKYRQKDNNTGFELYSPRIRYLEDYKLAYLIRRYCIKLY